MITFKQHLLNEEPRRRKNTKYFTLERSRCKYFKHINKLFRKHADEFFDALISHQEKTFTHKPWFDETLLSHIKIKEVYTIPGVIENPRKYSFPVYEVPQETLAKYSNKRLSINTYERAFKSTRARLN